MVGTHIFSMNAKIKKKEKLLKITSSRMTKCQVGQMRYITEKWKGSHSVVSDCLQQHGL